jgi:hypothetical protein
MVAQVISNIYSITIISSLPGHGRVGMVRTGFAAETGIEIHLRYWYIRVIGIHGIGYQS